MLRKIRLILKSYNCYRILQNNIQLPCKKILPIIPSAVKFRLKSHLFHLGDSIFN